MTTYDNTNRGILGRNKRKEKDSHPDFSGSINVEGHDYWLSGWLKENANGKFFSLSIKPKNGTAEHPAEFVAKAKEVFPGASVNLNDEVPFTFEWR